ncbi:hypothetical protein GQ600_22243 [Phytophthora cactorum]|nr:hypothetical protein GQ600_22243 [Phytophthora cactorum]
MVVLEWVDPCSEYTFSGTGSSDVQAAECATYSASLCYPGVCEAPEWMDQTVDIFVKRLPSSDPKSATNMWLLQGGPGFASNDSQAITSGSPRGKSMDPSEVPSCAQALEDKYGDLASFSTTSAAKDLEL